ncbi:MAG: hypothetical protein HY730_04130 [Candidatus Tectomicrobia bacterium]|uniref:Uncharacterized protein n=1 Tax=Tectimicrobiota bacterium TaxID=2528274 RepID=A0A933GN17_UNCTE|nr:hypothetical protein [Candidatus Tectomicrobia bacterium]
MNWYQEWRALSARIQGLLDAGSFFYSAAEHSSSDNLSVRKKILLTNAEKIFSSLTKYLKEYESTFPEGAFESLKRFLEQPDIINFNFRPDQGQIRGHVQFALTSLAAFQSEFSYIIADTQALALRITERAFAHLQRSIIADDEIKKKWLSAFDEGEPKCEKLGALHLLLHGVWAFKAYAEKGRTDLILNEPLSDTSIIEKSSTALVLTEWKVVRQNNKLEATIREAYEQTKIYTAGVLSGIELANYRYLVMVSKKSMKMPADFMEGTIIYRHINVPVDPDTPSKEAKNS